MALYREALREKVGDRVDRKDEEKQDWQRVEKQQFTKYRAVTVGLVFNVVIYGVIELFLGWTGFGGNVAHFAHVGGMLWGLLLLQWWKRNGTIRF